MIISFNPDIFHNTDDHIQADLAKILIFLMEKGEHHIIEMKSLNTILFNEDGDYKFDSFYVAKNHFSNYQKKLFKDYIYQYRISPTKLHQKHLTKLTIGLNNNGVSATQLHHKHLTKLTIGFNDNEVLPDLAQKILGERSIVIVENATNDWKFIQGLCYKYTNHKKRASIYALIKKAIDQGRLIPDNAGGSGVMAQLKIWIEGIYQDFYKHKIMSIFDSDKQNPTYFKTEYKSLIEYLKQRSISTPPSSTDLIYEDTDRVLWHMLYKRAMENYVPINILKREINSLNQTQKNNLNTLAQNPIDVDYVVYYKPDGLSNDHYMSIGKSTAKATFPAIFLSNFSYSELEERCEHHKAFSHEANEQITEVEQILLKIAKII